MLTKFGNSIGFRVQEIDNSSKPAQLLPTLMSVIWFKCLGTMAFIAVFFSAYFYVLKNPATSVTTMPITLADRLIGFEPLALPIYLSLWFYVSMPPMLMRTRRELIEYGLWIGGLCIFALLIFYFFPNAVPPSNIDWARYPGVAFLKDVDVAGNACPSLHVATAVFSGFWMHWLLPRAGLAKGPRLLSALWCIAIAYSTIATKQHVAVDVIAGGALGTLFAWFSRPIWLSRS